MGLLDDLEFLKKQRKPNLLANTRQLQRPAEPYLRQQYPEVYGALGGLLGMAPDEMDGSVLDPNTARVRAGAEYGFPVGTATQMLPMAKPAQATAMAAGQAGERLAERVVPRVMQRGGMGAEMLQGMSRNTVSPLDVYHGTPHTLPPTTRNPLGEFDASKIGTGEGAQAYGYGIYTAENPAVAKEYQFMQQNWFDTGKAKYKGKSINSWYEQAQKDQERAFRTNNKALEKDASAKLAYWENIMTHNHPESVVQQFSDPAYGWPEATNYANSIDLTKFSGIPRSGNLYKVDLPDEQIAKMLDWDKPMSDQPKIMKALTPENMGLTLRQPTDGGFMAYVGINGKPIGIQVKGGTPEAFRQKWIDRLTEFGNAEGGAGRAVGYLGGTSTSGELAPAVSNALRQAGIPGIKYLDEGSRGAGQGTRNFVTFPGEEQSMTILERNGQPMVVRPQQQDVSPDLLQYQQMLDEEERKKLGGLLFR